MGRLNFNCKINKRTAVVQQKCYININNALWIIERLFYISLCVKEISRK